jgi:hypothetical protein
MSFSTYSSRPNQNRTRNLQSGTLAQAGIAKQANAAE